MVEIEQGSEETTDLVGTRPAREGKTVALTVPAKRPDGEDWTKTQKVALIARWQQSQLWPRGCNELKMEAADAWGHSPGYIEQLCAMAATHRELMGDKDHIEQMVKLRLMEIGFENAPDRVNALNLLLKNLGRDGRQIDRQPDPTNDPDLKKKIVNSWANPNRSWSILIEAALVRARDKGTRLRDIVERVFGIATEGAESGAKTSVWIGPKEREGVGQL